MLNLTTEVIQKVPTVVVLAAVWSGAISDVRHFRLPNSLTLSLTFSGIIWHVTTGGLSGLQGSLIGLTVAALPPLLMFVRGGMGAGDVKLMAGIGAWMGAFFSLHVLLAAGVFGLLFAIGAAILRGGRPQDLEAASADNSCSSECALESLKASGETPDRIQQALGSREGRVQLLPFGLMIALGTLLLVVFPLHQTTLVS